MTVAPGGVAIASAGPTASMRSPRITTVVVGIITPRSDIEDVTVADDDGSGRRLRQALRERLPPDDAPRQFDGRSVGIARSTPGRTGHEPLDVDATNSPRSSIHTPLGWSSAVNHCEAQALPRCRLSRRAVSAMISRRARPCGSRLGRFDQAVGAGTANEQRVLPGNATDAEELSRFELHCGGDRSAPSCRRAAATTGSESRPARRVTRDLIAKRWLADDAVAPIPRLVQADDVAGRRETIPGLDAPSAIAVRRRCTAPRRCDPSRMTSISPAWRPWLSTGYRIVSGATNAAVGASESEARTESADSSIVGGGYVRVELAIFDVLQVRKAREVHSSLTCASCPGTCGPAPVHNASFAKPPP